MIIPCINADSNTINCIPKSIPVNWYFGPMGSLENKPTEEMLKRKIVMIHMEVPNDTSETYVRNAKYLDLIRKLGRVGLTFHYKSPKSSVEINTLYWQITWIHEECPEAVFYIENEHYDLLGAVSLVNALRSINIESYLLIDTCHLQMDLSEYSNCIDINTVFKNTIATHKDFIGAFHLSCSQASDGYDRFGKYAKHGKPMRNKKDKEFFIDLCKFINSLEYKNDIYAIPEVIEKDYTEENGRKNGKACYKIMKEVFG